MEIKRFKYDILSFQENIVKRKLFIYSRTSSFINIINNNIKNDESIRIWVRVAKFNLK